MRSLVHGDAESVHVAFPCDCYMVGCACGFSISQLLQHYVPAANIPSPKADAQRRRARATRTMLGRRRGVLWLGLLALAGAEDAPPPVAPEVELDAPAEAPAPPPPVEELPPLPADLIVPKLSFSNPFNQYDNGLIPGWQYGGEATLANDYISLTPAAPNKVGWVWSDEPVSMAAWEVALEFHIGGQANRGAGGGMAFWFSAQQGRTGPIYGHEDNYEGLGVFFDTCAGGETRSPEPPLSPPQP